MAEFWMFPQAPPLGKARKREGNETERPPDACVDRCGAQGPLALRFVASVKVWNEEGLGHPLSDGAVAGGMDSRVSRCLRLSSLYLRSRMDGPSERDMLRGSGARNGCVGHVSGGGMGAGSGVERVRRRERGIFESLHASDFVRVETIAFHEGFDGVAIQRPVGAALHHPICIESVALTR